MWAYIWIIIQTVNGIILIVNYSIRIALVNEFDEHKTDHVLNCVSPRQKQSYDNLKSFANANNRSYNNKWTVLYIHNLFKYSGTGWVLNTTVCELLPQLKILSLNTPKSKEKKISSFGNIYDLVAAQLLD